MSAQQSGAVSTLWSALEWRTEGYVKATRSEKTFTFPRMTTWVWQLNQCKSCTFTFSGTLKIYIFLSFNYLRFFVFIHSFFPVGDWNVHQSRNQTSVQWGEGGSGWVHYWKNLMILQIPMRCAYQKKKVARHEWGMRRGEKVLFLRIWNPPTILPPTSLRSHLCRHALHNRKLQPTCAGGGRDIFRGCSGFSQRWRWLG